MAKIAAIVGSRFTRGLSAHRVGVVLTVRSLHASAQANRKRKETFGPAMQAHFMEEFVTDRGNDLPSTSAHW